METVSHLGLPQQNTMAWVAATIDIYFSHCCRSSKFKIRVPARLVPGLQVAVFLCPHMAFPLCMCGETKRSLGPLSSLLYQSGQFRAPPLQPHSTLITFVKALSPNAVTLGAPVSACGFWGARNSVHGGNLWGELEKGSLDEEESSLISLALGVIL